MAYSRLTKCNRGGCDMNRHITRESEMIRQARLRMGYSQQHVATMLGMQIRQYQRLEYGEREIYRVGFRAGLALCAALHLDPVDLVFGDNPGLLDELINQPGTERRLRKRRKEC